MQPNVRAVTLTSYLEVASFVGLDPFEMLRRVRISPEMLADPENRIPARSVCDLLEESARTSTCATFGLAMAQCRSFASLGPISLLLEHLGSAGEVVTAVTEYRRHLNDILILGVDQPEGDGIVRVELLAEFATPQASDLALGVGYVALKGASHCRWQPLEVHFSHGPPEDRGFHDRFFAAPVEFKSEFNGFICSRQSMHEKWPWSNQTMAAHARRLLALVQLGREAAPVSESVIRIISLSLPSGRASLSNVAAQFGKSPRSLQRSLAQEGRQFAELLNEVRRALVLQQLSSNGRSITSIAAMLGFFTPSSFSRWFASEFGVAPRTWRAEESRTAAPDFV